MTEALFRISSNWVTKSNRTLQECIITDYDETVELEDLIEIERCVLLSESGRRQPCDIVVESCSPTANKLSKMEIISGAKTAEVFGDFCEYLTTVFGEKIDELNETSVYKFTVNVKIPAATCRIKLLTSNKRNEIWIYGVRIESSIVSHDAQRPDVDIAGIKNRLSDVELTDKAASFMKLIETAKRPPNRMTTMFDPETVLKYLPLIRDKDDSVRRSRKTVEDGDGSPVETSALNVCENLESIMKRHLTDEIKNLENSLCRKIDAVEARINVRLDSLLQRLPSVSDSRSTNGQP